MSQCSVLQRAAAETIAAPAAVADWKLANLRWFRSRCTKLGSRIQVFVQNIKTAGRRFHLFLHQHQPESERRPWKGENNWFNDSVGDIRPHSSFLFNGCNQTWRNVCVYVRTRQLLTAPTSSRVGEQVGRKRNEAKEEAKPSVIVRNGFIHTCERRSKRCTSAPFIFAIYVFPSSPSTVQHQLSVFAVLLPPPGMEK